MPINFRRFECLVCKKIIKERRDLKGFKGIKTMQKEVEVEYHDFCDRCAQKQFKKERFEMRVGNALTSGIISKEFYDDWKAKKICQKEFVETLMEKENSC